MKHRFFFFFVVGCAATLWAADQSERTGLDIGVAFSFVSIKNAHSGSVAQYGIDYPGLDGNATKLSVPFGFASYSEEGQAKVMTGALEYLLFLGTGDKDTGEKPYAPYVDDSTKSVYVDWDFLTFSASGKIHENLPILVGIQGGISVFGIENQLNVSYRKTAFNNGGILTYGLNAGFTLGSNEGFLIQSMFFYDWIYFMSGVNEATTNGNRWSWENDIFPFADHPQLRKIHFRFFVKSHFGMEYKRPQFGEGLEYSDLQYGFGVSYFY